MRDRGRICFIEHSNSDLSFTGEINSLQIKLCEEILAFTRTETKFYQFNVLIHFNPLYAPTINPFPIQNVLSSSI